MQNGFDIAVLGATPAGFAAAYYLARKKRSVIVLDVPRQSAECSLADWVAPEFFRLSGLPSSLATQAHAIPFQRVEYHSAMLDRTVAYAARTRAGYFLQTADLSSALRKLAEKSGVTVRSLSQQPRIQLEEDSVTLAAGRKIRASLLMMVQDRPLDALRELSLPLRNVPSSHLLAAGLDVPLKERSPARRALQGAMHVVEFRERTELGLFFVAGNVLHLRIVSSSRASGTRARELSQMVRGLQERRILPADLPLDRAQGAVWYPPAGMALELEAHVAKRCLLAGTAGGFADTITGHTLLPSVKSALLACDVALTALKSPNVQEALMVYKTLWRKSLADYLRPPNTSLQMLLPLLFANQKIVSRFTRAMLYGETI